MKAHLIATLEGVRSHPIATGIIGSLSGWVSVDLLRAAQFFAGVTAGVVSLLTAVIIAPKAWAQAVDWYRAILGRKR